MAAQQNANGDAASAGSSLVKFEWSVDMKNIETDAKKILKQVRPTWPEDRISFKYFTEGITNKLVGAYLKDSGFKDVVLIRVNGDGTEAIIDRAAEVRTFQLLHKAGCGPPIYALFSNGMAYGFVAGSPLDEKIVREEKVAMLIAQEMARLHQIQPDTTPPSQRRSEWSAKAQVFLNNIPTSFPDQALNKRFLDGVPSMAALKSELVAITAELESLNMPVVFSHNDLLLKNIIYNSDAKPESIHFIDFEYGFLNYQAYDIGNHFAEYAGVDEIDYELYPGRDYQLWWLRGYLQYDFAAKGRSPSEVKESDVERLYVQANKCALAAHFLWSLWALIQAKNSSIDFDFLGYAIARLNEYFRRKKEFLPLTLPQTVNEYGH